MTNTYVYLLRHAQSAPSHDVPEPEWPLSPMGIEQAENLVESLSRLGIDTVFSSPFRRAKDTVAPFCTSTNTEITIKEDLRERKLKNDDMVDDWKVLIEKAWQDFSFAIPGCESGYSCQSRIAICLLKLVKANSGKRLLVSSHGNAIGLYLNMLDSSFGFLQWRAMKNPDLFKIAFVEDAPHWKNSTANRGVLEC